MDETILKYILDGTKDITDDISGTSLAFNHEVIDVFIDGVSTAFTWSNNVLTVPSYTSGNLIAKFRLYLIYGQLSEYGPQDPENPASDIVFWEERISRFPQMSGSIKDFMSGTISYKLSSISFNCLSGWDDLLIKTVFVSTQITAYLNDVLLFSGTTTSSSTARGLVAINIKNLTTSLDIECNWGDPTYLNRIEPGHNSAFYNAANIPERYYGKVIPFVIGDRSAYEDVQGQSLDAGDFVWGGFALVPQNTTFIDRNITSQGNYFCIEIIPTGSTTGILCRLPSVQTLQSSITTGGGVGLAGKPVWSKIVSGAPSTVLPQQLLWLDGTTPQAAVANGETTLPRTVRLTQPVVYADTFTQTQYDTKLHLISKFAADYTYRPANVSLGTQTTPGGHKFMTITAPGCDFKLGEHFLVCSDIAGSMTLPKVVEFVLSSHSIPVDSASFTAMASTYTQKTCIQIGQGTKVPTVNQVVGELNQGIMAYCQMPLDGSSISMNAVDFTPTPSIYLTSNEIKDIRVMTTQTGISKTVNFEPRYARGTIYRDSVYESLSNPTSESIYDSEASTEIKHCLTSKASSRWQEIADFLGKPSTVVTFMMLDSSISIELGDYVSITHEDFEGIIFVTGVDILNMGYGIKGRFIA